MENKLKKGLLDIFIFICFTGGIFFITTGIGFSFEQQYSISMLLGYSYFRNLSDQIKLENKIFELKELIKNKEL